MRRRILRRGFPALAVIVLVAGCAGRVAVPVAITQGDDQELSCVQLRSETARNEQQAQTLYEQHKKAGDANIAIGTVGVILFWPALFALDTGTAEKDEARALEARNIYLRSLSLKKNCGTTASDPKPAASPTAAVAAAPAPPPAARPVVPVKAVTREDRLRSLQDMLDRNAITRTDFEKKRAQILSGQ